MLTGLREKVSIIHAWYLEQLGLEVNPIKQQLDTEKSSGEWAPHSGYVEVNSQIPEFNKNNEDVLMLVGPNTRYWE